MSHGVKVRIIATDEEGLIVRRLDADSYMVSKGDEVVVLSPKEFKELNDERS